VILPDDSYFDDHLVIGVRPRASHPDESEAFDYSVNLSQMKPGWPEFIGIGFPAGGIINKLAAAPEPPLGLVRFESAPVTFLVRLVDRAYANANYTFQVADPTAPIAQIIVPDPEGRFPWDDGCDPPYRDQTLLPLEEVSP